MKNVIIRVGDELLQIYDLIIQNEEQPKITSKRYAKVDTNFHRKKFTSKVMHGYFNRIIEKDEKIYHKTSKSWTKNQKMTSHFEGHIAAIQEQEILTKYLINKRARDAGKKPPYDNKCCLCKTNIEDVIHIISCCPFMFVRYYLPMRYDMVAKTFYKEIIKKDRLDSEVPKEINEQEYIQKVGDNKYWCSLSINTAQKVSHYHYKVMPIIVGALGSNPNSLNGYLCQLGFYSFERERILWKMKSILATATAKICKSFLKFL